MPRIDDPMPCESRTQRNARIVLGVTLLGLGVYTLLGFLPALVWGTVFVIALWPFFQRTRCLCKRGDRSWLLPILFTVCVALVFIVPLTLAGLEASQEVRDGLHWIYDAQRTGVPQPDFLQHLPIGAMQISAWWQKNLASPSGARLWVGQHLNHDMVELSRHVGSLVVHRAVLFGFTLLTVLFLFRYGDDVAGQVRNVGHRVFGPRSEHISRNIVDSVRGTVSGLVLVGLGQGLVLGIAYAFAGVPHAVLFGTFTAGAAMIPFGAPIAYGIASFILLMNGSTGWAIGVFALGSIVLFIADHFIRPVLIGGATRMPFIWVLLGILGGVESWGLLGLFIGPAIMAALIMLWRELSADHDLSRVAEE